MKLFKEIKPTFLCLCWKITIFKIWIWVDILFGPLYNAWTLGKKKEGRKERKIIINKQHKTKAYNNTKQE